MKQDTVDAIIKKFRDAKLTSIYTLGSSLKRSGFLPSEIAQILHAFNDNHHAEIAYSTMLYSGFDTGTARDAMIVGCNLDRDDIECMLFDSFSVEIEEYSK